MMTVKQVSQLTGVSVRTLQFYDRIGLFKPAATTEAGYRLYEESSLEELQQILFFKELDFTLKEIKAILEAPQFDSTAVYRKQRELLRIKRDRLNALLELLDRLIKGEKCMEFKDFDENVYFTMLENFKKTHTENIIDQLGSIENYNALLSELKAQGEQLVEKAVQEYGSLEKYAEAMKEHTQAFLENGPSVSQEEAKELADQTDALTRQLTEDLTLNAASPEVQEKLKKLIVFTENTGGPGSTDRHYWSFLADAYLSNPSFQETADRKYGSGAARFISKALKTYLDNC